VHRRFTHIGDATNPLLTWYALLLLQEAKRQTLELEEDLLHLQADAAASVALAHDLAAAKRAQQQRLDAAVTKSRQQQAALEERNKELEVRGHRAGCVDAVTKSLQVQPAIWLCNAAGFM
jgi:hypothetical protein